MSLLMDSMRRVVAKRKTEIELREWSKKILAEADTKGNIFQIEPVVVSVHPLGKRDILPRYEKRGWDEESLTKIETEGSLIFESSEEQKKMKLYHLSGIEGVKQIQGKHYVIVLEGDSRLFHIDPEDLTHEELTYVLTHMKQNGDVVDRHVLPFFLRLIEKDKQKKTS